MNIGWGRGGGGGGGSFTQHLYMSQVGWGGGGGGGPYIGFRGTAQDYIKL